jgi:hypothetical protein
MVSSNLPPGVRESDIPGNRPEDLGWEMFEEWGFEEFRKSGLDPDECRRAVLIGIAGVKAEKEMLKGEIESRVLDEVDERVNEEFRIHWGG